MRELDERNLQRFLEYHGIDASIVKFDKPVMKSEEAEKLTKEGIVVKSILLVTDGRPLLCILMGKDRIDLEKIRKLTKANEVRLAKAKEVIKFTGYDIGGVPAFGHLKKLDTIVDEEVFKRSGETFFMGGGSHYTLLRIKGEELFKTLKKVGISYRVESIRVLT